MSRRGIKAERGAAIDPDPTAHHPAALADYHAALARQHYGQAVAAMRAAGNEAGAKLFEEHEPAFLASLESPE